MTRNTYFVNRQSTGRRPVAVLGQMLNAEDRSDHQRVTLAEAKAWMARQPHFPGSADAAWHNAAGRSVLTLAGKI